MSIKNLDLIKNSALFRKKYHDYVANYIKDLNTCMDKAAASRVMKTLENKNLIMRVKNKADKRSLNIYFTEEGKKLIPIINKILDDWYLELSNAMGSEKLDLLISLFTELNEKHP